MKDDVFEVVDKDYILVPEIDTDYVIVGHIVDADPSASMVKLLENKKRI